MSYLADRVALITEQRNAMAEALEAIRGDLYLWRIGELSDEECLDALRLTVDPLPRFTPL